MQGLVLSLFPGADLLGMAFEAEGFCVVKGPELMMGGNVRGFHIPRGKFNGIIGGPPCQPFSEATIGHAPTQENLIPEYERLVLEGQPDWYLMEEVENAPLPNFAQFAYTGPITGLNVDDMLAFSRARSAARYNTVHNVLTDAWLYGSASHRTRRFSSNLKLDLTPFVLPTEERHPDPWPCITATENKYCGGTTDRRRAGRKVGRQMTIAEVNVGMGLPEDFSTPCLLREYQYKVRGNGVPLQLGRAVARAVKDALQRPTGRCTCVCENAMDYEVNSRTGCCVVCGKKAA